jgi:anti-sigma regulatory factor (Ser/Thr protein kinase)
VRLPEKTPCGYGIAGFGSRVSDRTMPRKPHPPSWCPPVTMSLEAKPQNAAVARRVIADAAASKGLADRLAADAKVVVTESFTNATRHAYSGRATGRVVVEAEADDEGITIAVRDSGEGFRPRLPEADEVSGLGLALIAALSDRVELRRLGGGGTEVRARLEARGDGRAH